MSRSHKCTLIKSGLVSPQNLAYARITHRLATDSGASQRQGSSLFHIAAHHSALRQSVSYEISYVSHVSHIWEPTASMTVSQRNELDGFEGAQTGNVAGL